MSPHSAKHPHRWRRIAALALLFCAVVWAFFSKSAHVIAEVAIGEGILHSAGTVQATYNVQSLPWRRLTEEDMKD